jgi:hypothetical protein
MVPGSFFIIYVFPCFSLYLLVRNSNFSAKKGGVYDDKENTEKIKNCADTGQRREEWQGG